MDYHNEQEQLEAIKKWWKKNGKFITTALILGFSGLIGFKLWNQHQLERIQEASVQYQQLLEEMDTNNNDAARTRAQSIINETPESAYASLSALILARIEYDANNLQQSEQQLGWVIKNSESPELKNVATLRLARILFYSGRTEEALSHLRTITADAFLAESSELEGDIHTETGELGLAKTAYDRALESTRPEKPNQWLQAKRDALGK